MRVIVLGGNQSLRMGMRVLTCQMLRNMQTFLVSDIPLLVAGEEFMVREKPIREKFIILWKYIYPWFLEHTVCNSAIHSMDLSGFFKGLLFLCFYFHIF